MRIDLPNATAGKDFGNHLEPLHLPRKKPRLREGEDVSKVIQPVNIRGCAKVGFGALSTKLPALSSQLAHSDLGFRSSVFNIFPGSLHHQFLKSLDFWILTFQNYFEQNVSYTKFFTASS